MSDIFNTVADWLSAENGEDLPDEIKQYKAQQRFEFTAVLFKQVHHEAKEAKKCARGNKDDIIRLKSRFLWLAGGNGLGIMVVLGKLFNLF